MAANLTTGNLLRVVVALLVLAAGAAQGHVHSGAASTATGWQIAGHEATELECSRCAAPAPAKLATASLVLADATGRVVHGRTDSLRPSREVTLATRSRSPPQAR